MVHSLFNTHVLLPLFVVHCVKETTLLDSLDRVVELDQGRCGCSVVPGRGSKNAGLEEAWKAEERCYNVENLHCDGFGWYRLLIEVKGI